MELGVFVKKSFKRVGFRAGAKVFLTLAATLLTVSGCGIPGGIISCTAVAPQNAVLTYQGSLTAANSSGLSGLVRVYTVNGIVMLTVEGVVLPTGVANYVVFLETRDTGVFYQASIGSSKCTQIFATGAALSNSNRFTQASIHLNSSVNSTLFATALLTAVSPNTVYQTHETVTRSGGSSPLQKSRLPAQTSRATSPAQSVR